MMTSMIARGEYPQVKLDDMVDPVMLLLLPNMYAFMVILTRKILCEASQCSRADTVNKGTE